MPFSLADILTSLQQGVQAINNLNTTLKGTFPQVSAVSSSATAGTAAYPATPAGFLTVTTSSGGTYKVILFNP